MFDGIISSSTDKIERNLRNFKHILVVPTIQKINTGFEATWLKVPVK